MIKDLFSESSILLSFHKGKKLKNKIINIMKEANYNGTSAYCVVEYLNIIMGVSKYLINKIEKYNSLEKTKNFIANNLNNFHISKIKWSFNLINEIYGNDDEECTERALNSLNLLRTICKKNIEKRFDKIEDNVSCYVYEKNYFLSGNKPKWKTPNCKRTKIYCKLPDFFKQNINIFKNIKMQIDNLSDNKLTDELKDFSKIIGNAIHDPLILCDYATGCKKLADAIIAVESKKFDNFFTQNYKESETLCKILNQCLYVLQNDPNKKIWKNN